MRAFCVPLLGCLRLSFACVVFALFMIQAAPCFGEGSWRAGVARANITPTEAMWMAGYASRDRPAEGKSTDLWAKALVLEASDGQRAVLLTADLVGIDRGLSVGICQAISEQYDLPRAAVAICTSHTHSGPVVGKNLAPMHYAILSPAQQALVSQYSSQLQATMVKLVGHALSDLTPCTLQQGTGTATFAVNRRNNPQAEVPERRTTGTLVGPVDHAVPVLSVRTGDDYKAIVFGYACHATVLSWMRWSGDYPGHAQQELERLYPGCQAMFWAGCGADQNPVPRRTDALAEHYGRRLATAVEAVLMTTKLQEVKPTLKTSYAEIDLEFDSLPSSDMLRQSVATGNRFEQARARMLLARIEAGQPLSPTYPYPIGVWQLGQDVRWVILGGEVVVDYALRLKSELSGPVWVTSYANDVMAYIPSRRVLREGGYEGATAMVYYGLPTSWAPTVENAIVNEVKRQLP